MKAASPSCAAEPMDAEDPLFILYTSGSTGKPKGVMHTTGGYLVYTAFTHRLIFDCHDGEIYFCAADIGWVTGHSFITFGPLCNGATTLMFEGIPNYPDPGRYWDIAGKHKVDILCTAPTAIGAIAAQGDKYVTDRIDKLDTLKLLGTVGEPINPEAWKWYYEVPGPSLCPIVDTYWQTETGGILITGLPGAVDMKPAKTTTPFLGVEPVTEKGNGLDGANSAVHPPGLPKTRSGKIMRRILRKIAANEVEGGFGDTSTLLDPTVVSILVESRLNRG